MTEEALASPALLVPMSVSALVLTSDTVGLIKWAWQTPNYRFLQQFRPTDPPPFSTESPTGTDGAPITGVVLRWSLPDGITHGIQDAISGQVRYPAVPNRWLVTRTAPDPSDPHRWVSRSWIVASDVVGDAEGSPFPDQSGSNGTTLGAAWPLEDWPGESAIADTILRPPLTAVGPGDATYGAFVPNVLNVFAFVDRLDTIDRGPLRYQVVGWYANPTDDPMYGATKFGATGWRTADEWRQVLGDQRWTVGDEQGEEEAVAAAKAWAGAHGRHVDPAEPRTLYPSRTVCHGAINGVPWLGSKAPGFTGVPTTNPNHAGYVEPRIAVAHNAVDALAVLLSNHDTDPSIAELTEAFAYGALDLLDEPDARAQLARRVEAGWFGRVAGGTTWCIVEPEDTDKPDGRVAPPPLTPDQRKALSALNRAQRRLDDTARTIAALRWERFALWWKLERIDNNPDPDPVVRDEVVAAAAATTRALDAAESEVAWLRQRRDSALVLTDLARGRLALRADAAPAWSAPAEPVLLISGARRSYEHGEDRAFGAGDELPCRFTGQAVRAVRVDVNGRSVDIDADTLGMPPLSDPTLPAETPDLWCEAALLDPSSAPAIAVAAHPKDPWSLLRALRVAQVLTWNADLSPGLDRRMLADAAGLVTQYGLGSIPCPLGIHLWSAPWSPLALWWQVKLFPNVATSEGTLDDWYAPTGTGTPGHELFAYHWDGPVPPPTDRGVTLSGSALLTPQITDVLAARLEQTLRSDELPPDIAIALAEVLLVIRRADLLSQSLTGFGNLLLQRGQDTFRVPDDDRLEGTVEGFAVDAILSAVPMPSAAATQFLPLRAGHMRIDKLWVVDDFGQVFDVFAALNKPPALLTERAPDMVTPGSAELIELKPRISQPTVVELVLLDALDDDSDVDIDGRANPIAGWLLHNRLDRAVSVYDADGAPLGELIATDHDARWFDAPTIDPSQRPAINEHVRGIINGVLGHATDAARRAALHALMNALDDAGWHITSPSPNSDVELPVLIGRPFAVVRGAVRARVAGPPAASQRWADTGRHVTNGFEQVGLVVQVGSPELLSDGVAAGWVNDDYRTLPNGVRPTVRLLPNDRAFVTLLVDPSGSITTISGLVPPSSVTLPAAHVVPALRQLSITFRAGPILAPAAGLAAPLPAVSSGSWSWLERFDPRQRARERPVVPADAVPHLPDALVSVVEGWLELRLGEQATTLTYAVTPNAVPCSSSHDSPTSATLQLTAYNGSATPVECTAIEIAIPVGTGSRDLSMATKTLISEINDSHWSVEAVGAGRFRAQPRDGGLRSIPAGATLTIAIGGLQVPLLPGRSGVTITEITERTRSTTVEVNTTAAPPTLSEGINK